MVYHADGRTATVASSEEENALPEGWSQKPSPVHTKPVPTPSVAAGSNDPLAILIRNVLEQVLDERGIGRSPGTHEHVGELPLHGHRAKR